MGYLMLELDANYLFTTHMVSSNFFYFIIVIICLCIIVWFQIFLYNSKNFQTGMFDPYMKLKEVLPLRVRIYLRVMAIKGYSTIIRALGLESYY